MAIQIYQKICWFDIPMDYAGTLKEVHRAENLWRLGRIPQAQRSEFELAYLVDDVLNVADAEKLVAFRYLVQVGLHILCRGQRCRFV